MKVVISDYYYESLCQEKSVIEGAGYVLEAYRSSTEEELIQRAANCDALIVQFCPVTPRTIKAMKRCKVIVRYAVGYETIDLEAADSAGIAVCNVPDYCREDVADHALMLLLACAKGLPVYLDAVRHGKWDYTVAKPLRRLSESQVGLIGFGEIAQRVAEKLQGFHAKLCAYDPYADADKAAALGVRLVDLDTLYAQSDFISLHCPLTPQTKQMLDRAAFSKMKTGTILVNTARGGLVNEEALLNALADGRIAAAGLDVMNEEPASPEHPLLNHPRVLVTPHIGWYSESSVSELQRKAAEEAVRVLQGRRPLHMVNHPRDV